MVPVRARHTTAGRPPDQPVPGRARAGTLTEPAPPADTAAMNRCRTGEHWGRRANDAPSPGPLHFHTLGRRSAIREHSSLLTLVGDELGAAPLPAMEAGREVNPWSELRCSTPSARPTPPPWRRERRPGDAASAAARPSLPRPRWSRAWPSARRPLPGRSAVAERPGGTGVTPGRSRGPAAGATPPGPSCSGLLWISPCNATTALPPPPSLRGRRGPARCLPGRRRRRRAPSGVAT